MNIILVSSRRPTVRTITLRRSHILAGCAAMLATLFVMAALINYALFRYAAPAGARGGERAETRGGEGADGREKMRLAQGPYWEKGHARVGWSTRIF